MRSFTTAIQNYINDGRAVVAHQLVYFWAKNRTSGLMETIGFWTGIEDATFTIGGSARDYIGRGAFHGTEPVTNGTGLEVRTLQINIAAPSGEAEDLVKGYETRFAPVQVHSAFFDAETRALVSEPVRDFKGFVDGIEFPTGAEPAIATINIVSGTRTLTRKLAGKKSHQTHKANGGDAFRRYGDVSGSIPVAWGELRLVPPGDPKPAKPSAPAVAPHQVYPKGP